MAWGLDLELFPSDQSLAAAERQLAAGGTAGAEALETQIFICWALRQRDSLRADEMAQTLLETLDRPQEGAAQAMHGSDLGDAWRARLQLVRAETALLSQRLDLAQERLSQALGGMEFRRDWRGCTDAHLLASWLASDRGDQPGLLLELNKALACAQQANDPLRMQIVQGTLARAEQFRDADAARQAWREQLPEDAETLDPSLRSVLLDYEGISYAMASDYLPAIHCFAQAFELSLQTGQVRRAITLATNLGFTYTSMSDYQTAMAWLRRALELARASRWPASISLCLAHTGEALRQLGQLEEACELLHECLQLLEVQPDARTTSVALKFLAQTELDRQRGEEALRAFDVLALRALQGEAKDLQLDAHMGRARALLLLERFDEAQAAAKQSLEMAQRRRERNLELQSWWILAEIRETARGLVDAEVLGDYAQALQLAADMPSYRPPVQMLDAAARAYAHAGQYEQAYHLAQRASTLRQELFSEETSRRSSAMSAHHQIESARAESEHLRRLAESEAARFELLKGSHEVLLHLNRVGQEITAELESARVFEVLERHVHAMLHALSLGVYLLDDSGTRLDCAFGMEEGKPFRDPSIDVAASSAYSARCVRERQSFVVSSRQGVGQQIPGTTPVHSVMFAPLMVAERIIGVMNVQSPLGDAYGEREQLIFGSLCAYAAIALDNARAYTRLSELQRHVMAQEKLAALGAMVAGVAHELNTPIGNSLLVASTLLSGARDFERLVADRPLKRSEWQSFALRSREGLEVIERSMESAADLVRSFKQVAVDRSAEKRRRFSLQELCVQCQQSLGLSLRRANVQMQVLVPAELTLEGFPGSLSQVLVILINNALAHAFEGRDAGRLELGAQLLTPTALSLWLQDDGVGMSELVLQRIFDPFFTTKFGKGGSGLGLAICRNIVETLLGGQVSVHSEPGVGSRFTLQLPLIAPDLREDAERA